jgi:protein-disulfide isomerase
VGKQGRVESRESRKAQAAVAAMRGRKRNPLVIGAVVVIVGLLVAIAAVVVNAMNGKTSAGTSGTLTTPAAATADGALVVGQAGAPVKLAVYLDYMCPYCGRFERANSTEIDRLVTDGTVRLQMHPLAFLDKASSGTLYSTRAANASATVGDRAPDQVLAFNKALFDRQPEENSKGMSDAQIATLAVQAGVPQPVVDVFGDGIFKPWVAKSTTAAFASGITGTPTVKINGTLFQGDLYTAGPLTAAITAAKAKR